MKRRRVGKQLARGSAGEKKPGKGARRPARRPAHGARAGAALLRLRSHPGDLGQISLARQLFWQNVVREMLTGLSMMHAERPELFDGRMGVLTNAGERIPIAEVFPMFACGVPGSEGARAASVAVECTVFRIRTPSGEMFTLPLHEIRALHALTPELLKQLEQSAMERMSDADDEHKRPFGLAAFTTLGTGEDDGEEEKEKEKDTQGAI